MAWIRPRGRPGARGGRTPPLPSFCFNDAANALYGLRLGYFLRLVPSRSPKPLLASDDKAVAHETKATMAWALDQCLVLLHPITALRHRGIFWGLVGQARHDVLSHADWPKYTSAQLVDAQAEGEDALGDLASSRRSAR